MEEFDKYIELQKLILSVERYDEIGEIKEYIDENNFFCNKTESFYIMRLLASIVYTRPKLINLIVQLLKQIKTIDIDIININQNISNTDFIQRTIVLYILLCLSGHMESKYEDVNLKISQIALIDPVYAFLKYSKNRHLYNKNDFNLIKKMPSEMKIQFRNRMHSTHPLVQIIIDDNAELLLEKISKNNIDIEIVIPKSLFEMHEILYNANLIQYASFLGSINCFKFLLLKSDCIDYSKLFEFAIAGGNFDIIHLVENNISKKEISCNKILNIAILYMQNDLIKYLIENYEIEINCINYINCIYASNYEGLEILRSYNQNEKKSDIFDSKDDFRDYLNFMISIPAIIGLHDCTWWRNTIIENAYKSRKYDILKYIYKYRMNHQKNDFEGILVPLIITFNYRYNDVNKYFQNVKYYDLNDLYFIENDDDDDDDEFLFWFYQNQYDYSLIVEFYYDYCDSLILSNDEVISKKQKERMIKKKLIRKEILKENKKIKMTKCHRKAKNQLKRNILLDKNEYLESNDYK